jgi:hypothetical protein
LNDLLEKTFLIYLKNLADLFEKPYWFTEKSLTDLLEKTRQDNLWNRDCPNDYKKCMNTVLDVWQHEYDLRRMLKGF